MFKLQKAFTLIELLVAVVVLGVVLAIGLPNFFGQMSNNRSLSLSADVVTALNFVRGEAIKRASRVSICPSTDGTSCGSSADMRSPRMNERLLWHIARHESIPRRDYYAFFWLYSY